MRTHHVLFLHPSIHGHVGLVAVDHALSFSGKSTCLLSFLRTPHTPVSTSPLRGWWPSSDCGACGKHAGPSFCFPADHPSVGPSASLGVEEGSFPSFRGFGWCLVSAQQNLVFANASNGPELGEVTESPGLSCLWRAAWAWTRGPPLSCRLLAPY